MLSYWEKQSFVDYDYLIIGAGIVGLSTAANLLEQEPQAKVAILERGLLPSGASTKNAGFACFGSLTELLDDIKTFGADTALEIVKARVNGLKKLCARIDPVAMDYQNHGGFELLNERDNACLSELSHINDWLAPLFPSPVFLLANEQMARFGFSTKHVSALILNPFEAQIHTGKMMRALIHHVQSLGANIITGAQVLSYHEHGDHVQIHVQQTSPSNELVFTSKKLALCTNAFAAQLQADLAITPGRGQVVITKPIPELNILGTFHAEQGYYYFRNIDNRILLGGARHHDINGETTTDFGDNKTVLNSLRQFLNDVIRPNIKTEIDYHWSGIMAFGDTKKPIVKQLSTNTVTGVRMGGMGIAIGSAVAEEITYLLRA